MIPPSIWTAMARLPRLRVMWLAALVVWLAALVVWELSAMLWVALVIWLATLAAWQRLPTLLLVQQWTRLWTRAVRQQPIAQLRRTWIRPRLMQMKMMAQKSILQLEWVESKFI